MHIGATAVLHFGYHCGCPPTLPTMFVREKKSLDLALLSTAISDLPRGVFVGAMQIALDATLSRYQETAAYQEAISALQPCDSIDTPAGVLYISATENPKGLRAFAFRAKGPVFIYSADSNRVLPHNHNFYSILGTRLRYIDLARDARVFGIVIYSVPIFNATKSRLLGLLQSHGKEYYLIYMGKPTPQKLLNFQDVDVFIRVSCPSAEFLDDRDFYKPVVTPCEFEYSLTDAVPDSFEADYRSSLGKPFIRPNYEEQETAISVFQSEAVTRFSSKSYKGLTDSDAPQSTTIVQGLSGFAQGYTSEASLDNRTSS